MGIDAIMVLLSLASMIASSAAQGEQQAFSEEQAEFQRQQALEEQRRREKADLLGRQSRLRQSFASRMRQKPIMSQPTYGMKPAELKFGPESPDLTGYGIVQNLAGLGQSALGRMYDQPRYEYQKVTNVEQ